MILKRRKLYSGYGEAMLDGAEYYSAQTGGYIADNMLDPADKFMEYYDKSPIKPRKVTGIRRMIKPLSYLLKRGRNKTKKDKK